MAKKLYLCFLWHMHQPYYKNPQTGKFEMPWVFLHAIKSYYDMPWLSATYGIKATFNLVPSLIAQLQDYKDPDNCQFLSLWKRDVSSLSPEEKSYLLRFLFSANIETMIKPLDRYYQLFLKRHRVKEEEAYTLFSDEEFVDIEVLFLLSWCGNYLRQNNDVVKELLQKGKNFNQEDKISLLNQLTEFAGSVAEHYKRFVQQGKVEISVSPFYHPIIPLLVDYRCAKESKPDISLPVLKEKFTDFARKHLVDAKDFYTEMFNRQPAGVWSSEGSLSNQTLKLFDEVGFLWTATDEQVLFNSLPDKNINLIYRRWKYGNINIFFRDRHLSDGIGFRYYYMKPDEAVKEFVGRLSEIYQKSEKSPVVSVILDGENPWEHYKNSGYDFLTCLYKTIKKTDWIETVSFSDVLYEDTALSNLENLVAGSWIYGNFTTWIGHPEKNTAWEQLDRTTTIYRANPDQESERYLMIAQGSDWFWWFGDDHFSTFSDLFDNLFRLNLKQVYILKGVKPPPSLEKPIKKKFKSQHIKTPTYYISPVLDGKISNYFEWLYAGELDPRFDVGSMTFSSRFERILYGYDDDNFYLYIQGRFKIGDEVLIDFLSAQELLINLKIKEGINKADFNGFGVVYGFEKGLEVAVPLKLLDGRGDIEFSLYYVSDGNTTERVPAYSGFTVKLDSFDNSWFV